MMTEGMINIGDWIKQWAMIKPNKIAIISDDIPYTYRELNRRINRLSHLFLELGVKKGDRVAVLLHNCKQFIEIFFSLSKLGGILVPLNWRLAIPELEFFIDDSLDYVILNNATVPPNALAVYAKSHEQPVVDDLVDTKARSIKRADLISHQFTKKAKSDTLVRSLIRHDSEKLAYVLISLVTS